MNRIITPAILLCCVFIGTVMSSPPVEVAVVPAIAASATTAAQGPQVELTKSCPKLRYLGRKAEFVITVANRGEGPALNVVVTDVIPAGIEFLSADNKGARSGNNIVWNLGTLKAGQSRTLKTVFACNRIGTYTNRAMVTYCAEASAACELDVRGRSAILMECVDDPDPIEIDGSVTYTITVTNQGTAVGTNIAIVCTLPAEEEFVSTSGPTDASVEGKTITFVPLPTLAPKAKAVYKVRVKGIGEGDVRFRVEMQSDQMDSPVMETESTHIYS